MLKKQFITGFISGALIFSAIGAGAAVYEAVTNPFPIQLNGQSVNIEGYNIDGSTYFKLRDIASVVGGFDVDFRNNTILLSKDGYVYETALQTAAPGKLDENAGSTYYVTLPGTDYRLVYNFNINSADAIRMNNEINSIFSAEAYSDDDVKNLYSYTFQYGSLCSIVTDLESNMNDYREIAAYTINTETGAEVTDSELLSYAGVSEEEMKNQLRNELLEKYLSSVSIAPSLATDTMKSEAISDKNIKKIFVDDDGQIAAILHYFSLAGGYNSWYYTGHTVMNVPTPSADPYWFGTYNSFYRVRNIGDLTLTPAGNTKFTAVYANSNGTTLEWQLDAQMYETGMQGELIYHYGDDFTLTYFPNDNHVEILSSDYTFAGVYELNQY